MLVESIFPTYLYNDIIPFDIDLDYLNGLDYKMYGCGTGHASSNQLILEEEPFAELRKQIDDAVNVLHYDVLQCGQGNPVLVQSWINYHNPGDHAPVHNHTNCCYSGVYYLNAPVDGGGIFFHHPHFMGPKTIKLEHRMDNQFNTHTYFHELKKNSLLIFPSHLPHSTEVNKSDQVRFSLAFNYFIEGQFGHQTSKINLRVVK